MEFFYITENADIKVGSENPIILSLKKPSTEITNNSKVSGNELYIATSQCLVQIQEVLKKHNNPGQIRWLDEKVKEDILNHDHFPISLTNVDLTKRHTGHEIIPETDFIPLEEKIQPYLEEGIKDIKIAIVNGMGTGLGDSIIGLRALQIFHTKLTKHFKNIQIDLLQSPFTSDNDRKNLYGSEKIISNLVWIPIQVSKLFNYDFIVDFSSLVKRQSFDQLNMIDFFLNGLGIDHTEVSADQKRNFIKLNDHVEQELSSLFKVLNSQIKTKKLLLHLGASNPFRSAPKRFITRIITQFMKNSNFTIITAQSIDKDLIRKYPDRIIDLSKYNKSLDHLNSIIKFSDFCVTTDTVVYHIADALNKISFTIFPNIKPERRLTYYPNAFGYYLGGDKFLDIHINNNEKEVKAIHDLWLKDKVANNIVNLVNENYLNKEAVPLLKCPVCDSLMDQNNVVDRTLDFKLVKCNICESESSWPRIPENYDEIYGDEYDHYLRDKDPTSIVNGYMNQSRFNDVKMFLDGIVSPNTKTHLDIGCANGFMVRYVKDLGFDSYGIDISEKAIKFANEKMKLTTCAVCSDLSKLPKELPQQYDLITSFEIVEHLVDPKEFAQQIYDKLKPGGYWIFSTPNRDRAQFKIGMKNTTKHIGLESGDYPSEHLTRFKKNGHEILANKCGFNIIHQKTSPLSPHMITDVRAIPPFSYDFNGQKLSVPPQVSLGILSNLTEKLCYGIEGHGNFLITYAQKPFK